MGTAITVGASASETEFQEKMRERMRQAMGDLMPDEVLKGIVARGIEEAFFKPQRRPGRNSWEQDVNYPSWLIEHLENAMRDEVAAAVKAWIVENQLRLQEMAQKALLEGVASAVVAGFNSLWAQALVNLQNSVAESFRKLGDASGRTF